MINDDILTDKSINILLSICEHTAESNQLANQILKRI